jgi:hypothetical protein
VAYAFGADYSGVFDDLKGIPPFNLLLGGDDSQPSITAIPSVGHEEL